MGNLSYSPIKSNGYLQEEFKEIREILSVEKGRAD